MNLDFFDGYQYYMESLPRRLDIIDAFRTLKNEGTDKNLRKLVIGHLKRMRTPIRRHVDAFARARELYHRAEKMYKVTQRVYKVHASKCHLCNEDDNGPRCTPGKKIQREMDSKYEEMKVIVPLILDAYTEMALSRIFDRMLFVDVLGVKEEIYEGRRGRLLKARNIKLPWAEPQERTRWPVGD